MNSFVLAYVGGIVGAVLMDITETFAARAGLTSGVNVALVGRWALGLLRGQWAHADIARSPARRGEVRTGWTFHFLVGGGGVALLYAAFVHAAGFNVPTHHLVQVALADGTDRLARCWSLVGWAVHDRQPAAQRMGRLLF